MADKPLILIIDDDKAYRDVLETKLQMDGFQTATADNGEIALKMLLTIDPVLILLDLKMPQMDGQTFFYHLQTTMKKNIPVIILSNMTGVTYPEEVKEFLIKSNVSLDDISEKIKTYLP